jgi:hypothetical protein
MKKQDITHPRTPMDIDRKYQARLKALEELDAIVEQGTSGIWTYRKWKSGIAECWGNHTDNTSTLYEDAGVGFHRILKVNLVPLFTSIENVQATAKTGNVGGVTISIEDTTTITALIFSTIITGRPIDLYIYARGRWK